jgi:hypothetical protein
MKLKQPIHYGIMFLFLAAALTATMIYASAPEMIGVSNLSNGEPKAGTFEIAGVTLHHGEVCRVAVKTGIGPWQDASGVGRWSYLVDTRHMVLRYEDDLDPGTAVYGPYYGELNIVIGAFDANGIEVAEKTVQITVIPEPPSSDIISGQYNGPLTVSLKAASEVSTYYTTDGTDPKTNGITYTGAINISQHTTIKAVNKSNTNQYSEITTLDLRIDPANPPRFQIQYYTDETLTRPVPDPAALKAGTYYLKVISDRDYSSGPWIDIDAPGSGNDLIGATLVHVSDCVYRYTRTIYDDNAATGDVQEIIRISGTDNLGNPISPTIPANATVKAAYPDTQPPSSGSIALIGGVSTANDPTPAFEINSNGAAWMRLALSEAGLSAAPWVRYTNQYDELDISGGGNGNQTIWIEFKDQAGNIQTQHNSIIVNYDNSILAFDIEYFKDPGLAQSLGNNPYFKEGVYYLKITANQDLDSNPLLQIDAEGTSNDVAGGLTSMANPRIFYFTRTIVADNAAVGTAQEQITVQGVIPVNADIKAAFTDTQAPDAPVVSGPFTTINRKPTWSWNQAAGVTKYRYSFSAGSNWAETTETWFTPDVDLTPGNSYTLYVQAGDRAGNWSSSGSWSVLVCSPDINVRQGAVSIPNGTGNYDFGNVSWGSNREITFIIENIGTSAASLTADPKVQIGGTDAASFCVTAQPLSPLEAGQSTAFMIRFAPVTPGTKSAVVRIASDDSDKNPYTFTITGSWMATSLALNTWAQGYIADPSEVFTYSFDTIPGKPYGIYWDDCTIGSGNYTANLWITAYRQDLTTTYFSDTFNGYTEPQTFIAQDSMVYIKVRGYFNSTGSFALRPFVDEPVMSVKQGATLIPSGGSYDFGNVALCIGNYAVPFIIENNGTGKLNLTDTPKVRISGTDAASFNVSYEPPGTVAPGGSGNFNLRCVPTSTGPKTATVIIANNDPAGNPYSFTICANGTMEEPLTLDSWTVGTISTPGERKTYCFDSVPGRTYAITWDDGGYGSGNYTCDVSVSAYRQDMITKYFSAWDIGYSGYAGIITAKDNIVYISVFGDDTSVTGNFALKVFIYEPVIGLNQGTTNIPNGTGSFNFGNVSLCTISEATFTIKNSGNASLNLTGTPYIQISGSDASCFSIKAQPSSYNIFPSGSQSFTVLFTPTVAGTKTATITIPNNDSDLNPFTFTVSATGTGSFTPLILENWISGNINYTGVQLYSIKTTPGTAYVIGWDDTSEGSGAYHGNVKVSAYRQDLITPYFSNMDDGYYSPYIITAQEDTVYIKVAGYTTGSFGLLTSLSEPVINVRQGSATDIPNGTGSYDYGLVTEHTSKDVYFAVANNGDGNLHLTGTPSVQITGPDASSFSVASMPDSPVRIHSSSSFLVRFTPVGTGIKTATVSIASDDPDNNPYTFTISGYGTPVIEKTLSLGSWTEGNIDTAGAEKYYSFYTMPGRTYIIIWDDSGQGSGLYTGDIKITGYREDFITSYFNGIDPGYTTPQFVTALGSTINLKVTGVTSSSTGSFALKVLESKMNVKQGTTNIPNNTGSFNYGNVTLGSSSNATFTLQNNTNGNLNLTGTPKIQISGPGASSFSVTTQASSPVAGYSSTTFTVKFNPVGIGVKTATISIANDDSYNNPYTFTITGTGVSTNLLLGVWTPGNISTSGEVKTYYFYTTPGNSYVIAWDDSYQGSGSYYGNVMVSAYRENLTTTYFSNVNSGYTTPQVITAQENIVYIKVSGYYSSSTGSYAIKASLNKPMINVKQGTTMIPNGAGSYSFGSVSMGSNGTATFTIQNTGTGNLNLTGSPKVQISGADASNFSVTTQPTSPVALNGSTTFTVKYTPAETGAKTATVTINSDDNDNNPFSFTITGTGAWAGEPLTIGAWLPKNIATAGEIKTYYFTAVPGKTYKVYWDDSYQGSGSYTCDIKVSAYLKNLTSAYFTYVDSGYTTAQAITAQEAIVYIKVSGYYSSSTGSFALKVVEEN